MAREFELRSCQTFIKTLKSSLSLSDIFYSNLWQSLPEISPTMSSLWLISILFIKAKSWSMTLSHFHFSHFFLRSMQQRSLRLKSQSLNCGRKEIRWSLCRGQVVRTGEKDYKQRILTEKSGKRWRGDGVCQRKLCLVKHSPGICSVLSNREESLFLHFLFHTCNFITDCMAQCLHGSRNWAALLL